jgi:hypothetical protein
MLNNDYQAIYIFLVKFVNDGIGMNRMCTKCSQELGSSINCNVIHLFF